MSNIVWKYIALHENTMKVIEYMMEKLRITTYDRFIKYLMDIDHLKEMDYPVYMIIRNRGKYITEAFLLSRLKKRSMRYKYNRGTLKAKLEWLTGLGIGFKKVKGIYYTYEVDGESDIKIPIKEGRWKALQIAKYKLGYSTMNDVILYMLIKNYDRILNEWDIRNRGKYDSGDKEIDIEDVEGIEVKDDVDIFEE